MFTLNCPLYPAYDKAALTSEIIVEKNSLLSMKKRGDIYVYVPAFDWIIIIKSLTLFADRMKHLVSLVKYRVLEIRTIDPQRQIQIQCTHSKQLGKKKKNLIKEEQRSKQVLLLFFLQLTKYSLCSS